jgi:hypothetical protein
LPHKFAVDQPVLFIAEQAALMNGIAEGVVTRLMPMDGGEYQYDVRVKFDNLERRARESQLRPLITADLVSRPFASRTTAQSRGISRK